MSQKNVRKVFGPGAPDDRPVYDPAHRNADQSENKEFKKCYSADGSSEYSGHSVDVRELLEQGGWTLEPPARLQSNQTKRHKPLGNS